MEKQLWIVLVIAIAAPLMYVSYLRNRLHAMIDLLETERSQKRSLSASYGRITEQWFPLMDRYPYNSANFRFLGTPIDGVQFEEDKVVFVEFKSRNAELSTGQRRIKQLIQSGQVTWEEFHFVED